MGLAFAEERVVVDCGGVDVAGGVAASAWAGFGFKDVWVTRTMMASRVKPVAKLTIAERIGDSMTTVRRPLTADCRANAAPAATPYKRHSHVLNRFVVSDSAVLSG